MPIPWDKQVELFRPGEGLAISREWMTLREAVDAFMAMSRGVQDLAGIGVHEAMLTNVDGRPAALGFLNADAVRELAGG